MSEDPKSLAEVCGADILGRLASFLPPNEIACTLRLVNRSTADQFREHTVVRLSQPSPTADFAAHWSAPGTCHALSFKRRLQLVCLTAASGDVGNLEVALTAAGLCPTVELMAAAAAAGQLHACRWLAERGCPLEGPYSFFTPLTAAPKGGHAEVCEWLLEQGCAWEPGCVISAARGGHPQLMRALLRKAPPGPGGTVPTEKVLSAAAEGCDLGALQELWRERGGGDQGVLDNAASAAARSPTPDWAAKVAWLLKQGANRHADVSKAAASCPDGVARLTLLVEGMGFPLDASAFDTAAQEGRVDAVRWLLDRGLRTSKRGPIFAAAEGGHTEVLRALHGAGFEVPRPHRLVARACASGIVETVSWVVETWGPAALDASGHEAFEAALGSGSWELMTWLVDRGQGPGGPEPWDWAVKGGCVAALELMREWGADLQDVSIVEELYLTAASRGDLPTLEALRRVGMPLGETPLEARRLVSLAISYNAPLPALRWVRQAVGEVDWAAAAAEARDAPNLAGWRAQVQAWVQAMGEA